jgi:MFS family permease
MIANRVPLEHRGDALGKYSAIGVTVFVIGPVSAGLLTEAIDWRAVFALDAAIGAALVVLGWLRVDNRPVGEPEPFDIRGLTVLMIGLTALLVALMQALAWGWDSASTLGLAGAGLLILAAFIAIELRTEHPLLDVGLLRRRVLAGIVAAMFAAQVVVTGFVIYGATYFQHVLGLGPLLASLAIASSMFAEPLFNVLAGRVTDRIGPRTPALFGYLFTAAALAWIAAFADEDSYALLLPGLLVLNASIAPMFTSLLTGLSNAVPAEERGDANALVLTVRWIGAAVGTMVLGLVIHSGNETVVTNPDPYAKAFLILAGAALLGAIACALLLRQGQSR